MDNASQVLIKSDPTLTSSSLMGPRICSSALQYDQSNSPTSHHVNLYAQGGTTPGYQYTVKPGEYWPNAGAAGSASPSGLEYISSYHAGLAGIPGVGDNGILFASAPSGPYVGAAAAAAMSNGAAAASVPWATLAIPQPEEHFEGNVPSAMVTESKECQLCGSNTAHYWRKDGAGMYICNACGIYPKSSGRSAMQRGKPKTSITPVSNFCLKLKFVTFLQRVFF